MVVKIGLIGEYSPTVIAHTAITRAMQIASEHHKIEIQHDWLATDELTVLPELRLGQYQAFWCTPGSPYRSMDGSLRAIRYARESSLPFFGSCGGFQHAVIDIARNILNIPVADHAESNPEAPDAVITPLACGLIEVQGHIRAVPGSRLHAIYGKKQITETYHCNYGMNSLYLSAFDHPEIRLSGFAENGELRAIELTSHPFFVATLFQPERSALQGKTHPLISAFVTAAAGTA